MRCTLSLPFVLTLASLAGAAGGRPAAVVYSVAFPAPQHHYAQVELTLADLPAAPLQLRMSRSSPGRYALHEFAKNVFDVHAFDERGAELTIVRPEPAPVGRAAARRRASASPTRCSATSSTAPISASTPRTRT